ncbi:MAG: LacI family DNA-binding transcriptional regulator [Rhizobiaceae bacterium]|nr:LacI family DNA-binding transcriptional regulator [Rhizobiaceae bacterium]MCV0407946.1 LacI family DNA-binding transcriptional regulator [Rhizobiaceae bacterium]
MMDVASRAGVSQATVSLVLNDSPGVRLSDTTRERVREAADELGYQLVRRGQRKPPADQTLIAFIADEIATDPWMALAFDGAREKALQYGLTACLTVTRGDPEAEAMVFNQMGEQLLGVIYGTILTRRMEPSQALLDHNTVLLNCYDAKRRLPSVLPGELVGGRVATERLIQAGRQRIGLINGQEGLDASRDRLKGYRQALSSNDIPFDADLVKWGNWEPSSGYEMTRVLMTMNNPPDAIFCANDMMAVGCFDALREIGLRVPQDISVIGFDDREIAQFTRPPLTTLVLPHFEMGEIAAEFLIDAAGGLKGGPTQIKVECTLVERHSVD